MVTFSDDNVLVKFTLISHRDATQNARNLCHRKNSTIIARLQTGHLGGMKINKDGTRMYRNCNNCPNTELTLTHILVMAAV